MPKYLVALKNALACLAEAEAHAEAELSEEIRQEHRQMLRSLQIVSIWRELANKHDDVMALQVLALIAGFRSSFRAMEIEQEARRVGDEREANGLSRYDLKLVRERPR
jgi:hypothetical protein